MKKSDEIIRFAKDGKSVQEIANILLGCNLLEVLELNNQPVRRLEDGDSIWELHGLIHREDGPAIEYANGTRKWWVHGKHHREDGPAIEKADGTRWWYLHGEKHREDGPAIEYASGNRWWYWRDKKLDVKSQEEFEKLKPLLLIQDVQES